MSLFCLIKLLIPLKLLLSYLSSALPLCEVPVSQNKCFIVFSIFVLNSISAFLNTLFISFTAFYDCSANNFDKQFMITGFPHCVISMDYWYVSDESSLIHS